MAQRAYTFAKTNAAAWQIKLTECYLLYVSFKIFLDPCHDPHHHQNLIGWSLGHASPLQKNFIKINL